jgi:hypothetical protein
MNLPNFTDEQPAVDRLAVRDFAERHSITLPKPYRRFLIRCNGGELSSYSVKIDGEPFSGIDRFLTLGHADTALDIEGNWSEMLPTNCLPIAANAAGLYLLQHRGTGSGKISYWRAEAGNRIFDPKTWIAAGIPENIVATLFSAESTRERIRQSKHFNTVARTATTAVAPKFCVFLDSLEESS